MKSMEELRDMLSEELEHITEQGEITSGSLEIIDKLTHSIKSIDTIIAMEEAGYSDDGYGRHYGYGRKSHSRGRRGYSGRTSRSHMMEEDEM